MGTQLPSSDGPAPAAPAERLCGRCRRSFAGDPGLHFQSDWGLCPTCSDILLPRQRDAESE